MSDIPQEVIDRMEVFVRDAARWDGRSGTGEARAIVALLPKSVDPDIEHACALIRDVWGTDAPYVGVISCGFFAAQDLALAGIKRGRELASQSPNRGEGR